MPVYMDDKKLARRLLKGDARAFDRFFDDNFARLYRFAMARLSDDPEGARDVVQTAMTRALRKMHTYRAESAMFTWLCAICRNEINDWLTRQGRYKDHIVLVEDFLVAAGAVSSEAELSSVEATVSMIWSWRAPNRFSSSIITPPVH